MTRINICKEQIIGKNRTYSKCEHDMKDHEYNLCGDCWCNKCLNVCIFCEDCTEEIQEAVS